MCFLMGAAAGGMLPVANALLAETMPTRHRGWSLVLVGGIGAVGGYFVTSASSALLQPEFGWRILWFLNLPTGVILIALSPLLPESARFLQHMGRLDEARQVLAKFGAVAKSPADPGEEVIEHVPAPPLGFAGTTVALTLLAFSWGLVSLGLLVWLPGQLMAEGRSVGVTSILIAQSSLIAGPVILIATYFYSAWSTKYSLLAMVGIAIMGLICLVLRGRGEIAILDNPVLPVALLILGSSGVIAMLLPYTSENYPLKVRGRATGWIAGCSRIGGIIAQTLSAFALVPAIGMAAALISIPAILSVLLVVRFGRETRSLDLRTLERKTEPA
jgi:putative MFS transporter